MSTSIKTIERKPRVPGATPPLLLLLHGYGSNERDLFDFADYVDPRLHVVSARAPLSLPWGGFAWYEFGGSPGRLLPDPTTRTKAVELLERFVGGLAARVGADPRRVYLLGFSQGAILTFALAARAPQLLAGIIPLSGYLDTELLPGPTPTGLAALPILHMHGSSDTVIPVAAAHLSRDLIQPLAARYEYHEYPVGHSIHPDGLRLLQTWLTARLDEQDEKA